MTRDLGITEEELAAEEVSFRTFWPFREAVEHARHHAGQPGLPQAGTEDGVLQGSRWVHGARQAGLQVPEVSKPTPGMLADPFLGACRRMREGCGELGPWMPFYQG